MASRSRHKTKRIITAQRATRNAPSHVEKLRFVSRFKNVDPTSKSAVSRAYSSLKKIEHLHRPATKKQRQDLKRAGFHTTDKGVIIDGPRNVDRKPISGSKLEIQKDGIIKWSTKQRRDLTVGLSTKEKKIFVQNPKSYIQNLLEKLRKTHPSLKKAGDKIQVRLQWGAYQATKDFSPTQFTKAYPFLLERRSTKAKSAVMDRLTGIHIVYHTKGKK